MSQWYISQQGKAVGPVDREKIVELISRGELSHLDLVFAAGGTDWRPLIEFDEFAKYLRETEAARPSESGGAEWVLLKKVKTDDESQFQQMGPFSVAQVLRLIEEGEIRFIDFAWREGLESWVRISDVSEFNLPLPSSPAIDRELYRAEKTSAEKTEALETETMTDGSEDPSRLSQLIQIEKFDPAKTVVSAHPDKTVEINKLDSATESDVHHEVTTVSNVSKSHQIKGDTELWSLEPPDEKSKSHISPDRIRGGEVLKKAPEHRKKSARDSGKHGVSKKKRRRHKMDFKEGLQWAGAFAALSLAAYFFYMSFSTERGAVFSHGDDLVSYTQPQSWDQKTSPSPVGGANLLAEGSEPVASPIVESSFKPSVQPIPHPVPKQESSLPVNKASEKIAVAKASPEPRVQKKSLPIPPQKKQARISEPEKAKSRPAASQEKLGKTQVAKVKEKAKIPASKLPPSAKQQSLYKQRERKALFYSSLKAETLALEIQEAHRKLEKNGAAWNKFYTQWRQKVRASLAKPIRDFPVKGEVYAYPQILSAFKKDYENFQKFGESFDMKVKGRRVPSDAPTNMREVFGRYRQQAQSLGQ